MHATGYVYALSGPQYRETFETWSEANIALGESKNRILKKFWRRQDAVDFLDGKKNQYVDDGKIYMSVQKGSEDGTVSVGIYFGTNDTRNLSSIICDYQTAQSASLSATALVLQHTAGDITICTDCKYALYQRTKIYKHGRNANMLNFVRDLMVGREVKFEYCPSDGNVPQLNEAHLLAVAALL
jgi:ribonuclease HI